MKRAAVTVGLNVAALASAAGVLKSARGRGAIFTLHHVRPRLAREFDPNAHLEITPAFLDAAIATLRGEGYRFVSLDAVPDLLRDDAPHPPFAAFTLDDGYRNTADHAAPVFHRHEVPFTVFATKGFAERTHTLWWETAARLLAEHERLEFDFGGGAETLDLADNSARHRAFARIAETVLRPGEAEAVARLDSMARRYGIDPMAITRALTMDGAELAAFARQPFASLGAHTVSHRALAFLDDDTARSELETSAAYVAGITGERPKTLAYPYGYGATVSARDHALGRQLGFSAAVLTAPGTLSQQNGSAITALPRISLNGLYQEPRYIRALASGIAFRMMGRG